MTVTIMVTVTTKATSKCTRNKRIMNREWKRVRKRVRKRRGNKSRGVPLTRGEYRRVEEKRGKVRKRADVPLHCAILDLPITMAKPILSYFRPIAKIEARGSLDRWLGPLIKNCCLVSYFAIVTPTQNIFVIL
jgi:hypothetical protein